MTTRLRKVQCGACGYTVRVTRSWMAVGMPTCPCGHELEPESPADLAYLGRITMADVSQAAWNAICRENGWQIVLNQGQAAQAAKRGPKPDRRVAPAGHCSYPGCGRWVANDAHVCSAGHSQHNHELAAMPF